MNSAVSICGARGGQPQFRLRHVGARDLADAEAIAGLAKLLLQHLDVAALQIEDRGVADQVHVGGGGVEQDVCSLKRSVSRAEDTNCSACRVRLDVAKPLSSGWVIVPP